MGNVRIKVFGADGRYRGGFHRDDVAAPYRWTGRTQANLSEVMVCDGDPSSGSWLLLQYVLPRCIEGAGDENNPVDTASRCCERTVPQALLWFTSQDFGPPPALVERARRFAVDWSVFRSSAVAIALLEQFSHRQFTPCDHPAIRGNRDEQLELFERLGLTGLSSGQPARLFVTSLVADVGVRDFVDWMDRHVNAAAPFLSIPAPDPATAATYVRYPLRPTEWYALAEHVERAYDLMASYSGLLRHPHTFELDTDIEWSIWQIEVVMRRWFPPALVSGDPLIEKVHRLIGSHGEVKQIIDEADCRASRTQCLRSMAEKAHSRDTSSLEVLAICREDLRVWRSLLPDNWLSGVGPMRLTHEQRGLLHAPSFYWSMDFGNPRSWEGAALLLAAGCDRIAKLAMSLGLTTERVRTTLRLGLRLREFPRWSSIEDAEIETFVREQIVLARDFEELAEEIALLIDPPMTAARAQEEDTSELGDGGPGKTLDAVVRAAIEKHGGRQVAAELEVELAAVKAHLGGQDRKKAADYLSPKGRLSRGGWIRRKGTMVVLTQKGADEGNLRLRRKRGIAGEQTS